MALSGAFIADFKSFDDACKNSVVSLKEFESGGAKVESRMNRMADAFSGRKIVEEAKLMVRVFEESDNGARLTTAELVRMGSVGGEALEKLRKTGEPIPENLRAMVRATKDVGDAASATQPKVGGLHESLQSFDGILASMGIHIGPEIKAIGEIGTAGATGAAGLGLVATAGLALGAGMAAWKVTRMAMEFFDLDKAVAGAWAKLLGFGDVGAQTAGANADKLAVASAHAGHEITDLGVATAILSAGLLTHRTATQQSADTLAAWHSEIAKVRAGGDLPGLEKALKDNIFTVKELSVTYGISEEAINAFKQETTNAANADKAADAVMAATNATKLSRLAHDVSAHQEAAKLKAAALLAVTKLENEYDELRVQHGGTANDIAIAGIKKWAADTEAAAIKAGTATKEFYNSLAKDSAEKMRGVSIDWNLWKTSSIAGLQATADNAKATYDAMLSSGGFMRSELDKQKEKWHEAADAARGYGKDGVAAEEAVTAATKKHTEELEAQRKKEKELHDQMMAMGNTLTYDLSTQSGVDYYRSMNPGMEITMSDAQLMAFAKAGGTLQQLMQTGAIHMKPFASGGPTTEGPAYLHADEYVVPKGGALVTRGGGSGATVVNHNNFYLVDNTENLTRKVSDLIARQTLRGTQMGL